MSIKLYFNQSQIKKSNKNKRSPTKSDIDAASKNGMDLGKNWRAYSKESRVHIYVKDIKEMTRFYNKILEYPVVKAWQYSDGSGVIINIGGNSIELFSKNRRNYYHNDFSGCVSFSVRVSDVFKLHDKLSKKNIIIEDIKDNSWGDSSFSVKDPEGNRICFFSPQENLDKYYRVRFKN